MHGRCLDLVVKNDKQIIKKWNNNYRTVLYRDLNSPDLFQIFSTSPCPVPIVHTNLPMDNGDVLVSSVRPILKRLGNSYRNSEECILLASLFQIQPTNNHTHSIPVASTNTHSLLELKPLPTLAPPTQNTFPRCSKRATKISNTLRQSYHPHHPTLVPYCSAVILLLQKPFDRCLHNNH